MKEILSLKETLILMARRPGITEGGGIEMNTPNHDPRASEPPTTEDELIAMYRVKKWHEENERIRKIQENMRKKVSVAGGHYVKPRIWTPEERRKLIAWRNGTGVAVTGAHMSGRTTHHNQRGIS